MLVVILVSFGMLLKAQYSISITYANVDWIPKSNKVLSYENMFILQAYSFKGISIWQASCIAKSPNSYELGGVDYSFSEGKIALRIGFHGYFPKKGMIRYTDQGNLIPNIGLSYAPDSTQSITVNTYEFCDYGVSHPFVVSNAVYSKTMKFGTVEFGQYYNYMSKSLSGTAAYSKSWPMFGKIFGFASLRCSWNESRTKLNDATSYVVNIGLKF